MLLLSLLSYYLVCFMAVFTANKDVYEAPNHVPEAEQICIVFSVH